MVLTLSLMDLFLINADHVPEAEMAEQHHFQAPSYASLDHSRKHLQSMSDLTSLNRPGEKRLRSHGSQNACDEVILGCILKMAPNTIRQSHLEQC